MDYAKYIEAFNSGDDAALVRRFFASDCHFQSGPRVLDGADALLKFLNWAHDGIREIIRVQTLLQNATHIFAEIDMDFHATRDRPDFTFGPLKQGELTTVKFFVLYTLRDGKVATLKAATWPPKVGVTQPTPRLGASLEQRAAYLEYTRAFSNADFDKFSAYYTDDVRCELATMVLERREGIVSFYRDMFQTVRETITVHNLVADDNGLFAEITSKFTAIADAPNFVVAPLRKGEFITGRMFVYYTLRDGRIASIRVARSGQISPPQRPA